MDVLASLDEMRLKAPFRITGKTFESVHVLTVTLVGENATGRGEGLGVYYIDPNPEVMVDQVNQVRGAIREGASRKDLQQLLPPGGARNALDCAFWDIECKQRSATIWERLGIAPRALITAQTIPILDSAEAMANEARVAVANPVLKVKLDASAPVERMQAIRAARPDAKLIVDVNQGWTFAQLKAVAPKLAELDVLMIEQPLPRGADRELEEYVSPVPLCADESCLHLDEFEAAASRYQMINIKLDKCGGLTEALALADVAEARGIGVMVGNMIGTSLSMAPAFVIGLRSKFVDLDGPLFLERDVKCPLKYQSGGLVQPPEAKLWG